MPTKTVVSTTSPLLESGPWARIIAHYVEHYGNVGCIRWSGDLVYLEDGVPMPIDHGYRVLNGIARKAAVTLRNTCSACGRRAKMWLVGFRYEFRCLECQGKAEMDRQVGLLIRSLEMDDVEPLGRKPSVWFEHTVKEPLRSNLPEGWWRETKLPNGERLRYLAKEDLQQMTPWLKQVRVAMRVV